MAKAERPRAHRIEVDLCYKYPFRKGNVPAAFCCHPFALVPVAGAPPRPRLLISQIHPPDWCPLRGAVTMIAGPRG